MDKEKRIALIVGILAGTAIIGYLGYNWYKKSKYKSGDPKKDNRTFTFNK